MHDVLRHLAKRRPRAEFLAWSRTG